MRFVVREARVEDARAFAHVNVTSWRESYAHFLSAEFLADLNERELRERWQRGLERELRERGLERKPIGTHVLEVDGEVRGYASAGTPRSEQKPRDLELYMLYQLASEHGTGSGQALLDAALGDAPAFLWVAELNPRAIAFYRRNGFEPDGAREIAVQWENLAEIRMVRG